MVSCTSSCEIYRDDRVLLKDGVKSYSIKVTTLMGEEGDSYMGNPLHRFFKKLFTGSQKQAIEDGEVEVLQEVTEKVTVTEVISKVESQEREATKEKQVLRIEDYVDVEKTQLEFMEEANLVERALSDYIVAKVYEEKLIRALQEQGITKTSQMSSGVVAFMLDYPGMTESKVRNLLRKFKGYIPFKAVVRLFTEEEWTALDNTLDWCIGINIQPVYYEIKIKDVFKGNYFEPLCKLAKIKEISKLGEITTAFLVSYKNYTGVGEKKYKKTLEILAAYAMKDSSFACIGINQGEEVAEEDYEICIESYLYDMFSNYSLGQVGMLYGEIIADGIKNMRLKSLQGKSMNTVSRLINRPALEKGLKQISQIIVPSLAFERFNDQQGLEVLRQRFVEGCTLEETANKIGLTLEETSKLQRRTIEALTEILRSSRFVEILSFMNKGDDHVAFNVVETVLGEQNAHIVDLIKHNAFHDLGYNPIFNMVFLHNVVGENELMEKLAEILPEAFLLNSYKDKIEEAIREIGIKKWGKDVIPNLLEAMGYTVNGKLYSKGKISSDYILDMIFRHKVKKPIYLDEDAVEFLVEEAQKGYNYSLGNNIVTVERIIKETKEILLVGSNTYLHSSRLKCKEEVLKEIEQYLLALSATQYKVNSNALYSEFKDKLKGSSIQDQYGLYDMIFYYFGDRYKKEGEGSLNIILREEKQENSHIIGLEQVAPRLQQLINKHMDRGYIKTQEFLEEIGAEEGLQEFLQFNHLEDYKVLAKVLKLVDDTLLGEDAFLYRVNSLYHSLEELEVVEV